MQHVRSAARDTSSAGTGMIFNLYFIIFNIYGVIDFCYIAGKLKNVGSVDLLHMANRFAFRQTDGSWLAIYLSNALVLHTDN